MINLRNARQYIETFLQIRTKNGDIVPFKLNAPQERLYNAIKERYNSGKPVRVIVLKARQMGFSTLAEALIFWATATNRNRDSLIIAHKEDATANLYRMSKLYYERLPAEIKPMIQASNAQELVFDKPSKGGGNREGLHSRIRCATAGGTGQGRSYTLACVHMSEFAFWGANKMETYTGIMQAVPKTAGTIVIVESTANGYDDFKKLWDNAVSAYRAGDDDGFIPVFFPWWEMAEYRMPVPPNMELTAEERELKTLYGLDNEQIAWRRYTIKVDCGGDIDKFRQEYPASPDEAFIASGRCVFSQSDIVKRREAVRDIPYKRGRFEYDYDGQSISNIRWADDSKGEITIYTDVERGVPYVIGGDTAGTGSDSFVGQVLDNHTGKQVAVLRHLSDETFYARQMYCLGMYYNSALVAIETNYSTYPVMELQRLDYPRQYVRQSFDSYTGRLSEQYGFNTNTKTRPAIIDGLKAIARDSIDVIVDYDTLGEMLTFVYNDNYRPEAQSGEHDDMVMALAIAHAIRGQQSAVVATETTGTTEWSDSMREDFYNASQDEQKYLIKKWGYPKGGI